jgi:hypothetical protein
VCYSQMKWHSPAYGWLGMLQDSTQVIGRGFPSMKKVPCGTYEIISISASSNWKGIFLWDITCTLGNFFMSITINVSHIFVDDLISHLRKIL